MDKLNARLADFLSPLPASILIVMHPPTAKSAAKVLINMKIGVAKVTTESDKSSKYCPMIIVSATEPIAVVRFIKIVGASIDKNIRLTIGLCLYI